MNGVYIYQVQRLYYLGLLRKQGHFCNLTLPCAAKPNAHLTGTERTSLGEKEIITVVFVVLACSKQSKAKLSQPNNGEGRWIPLLPPRRRRRRGGAAGAGGDGEVDPDIPHQVMQGHLRAPGPNHLHWYPSLLFSKDGILIFLLNYLEVVCDGWLWRQSIGRVPVGSAVGGGELQGEGLHAEGGAQARARRGGDAAGGIRRGVAANRRFLLGYSCLLPLLSHHLLPILYVPSVDLFQLNNLKNV